MIVLLYGIVSYLAFLGTILYAIGFMANWLVPKGIDGGQPVSLGASLLVNLPLLLLFAVQHNVMARPAFKQRFTQLIPTAAERSTFVLLSSLILLLLFWQWRPVPEIVWDVAAPAVRTGLWILCGLGWVLVFVATFLIDHFDLFGLRQVVLHARGRPYSPPVFQENVVYGLVRHPLMLGFLIAFWATPTMTVGHLSFATVTTLWILVAIQIEERDLVAEHGAEYEAYRKRVSMLVPLRKRS